MKQVEKCSGFGIFSWRIIVFISLALLGFITGCSSSDDSDPTDPLPTLPDPINDPMGPNNPTEGDYSVETFVSGLTAPQGIEIDSQGRIWVSEQGTGSDDGRISMIDQSGNVHPFLTNIPSATEEGSPGSAHHLLIEADTIWSVVGITSEVPGGHLIKLDISNFSPGTTPLAWDENLAVANVANLVLNHNFNNQTNQSNAYNLTIGSNGNIYIVDAAANAVVEFDRTNDELRVIAELPTITNSSGVGPPNMEAVPTGIIYTDDNYLVSAFVGFPFNPGDSRIYRVTQEGNFGIFRSNFTGAVDMIGDENKYYVVEYGTFGQGFERDTGNVILIEGGTEMIIADNLNFPAGICMDNNGTIYVASMAGEILRLTKQ